jgi:hypothetical protein
MYISTGLESSKVNHLQELANSNNNNNNNNTSAQPDWHDVIQFVVAGNSRIPVLRWDKLESIGIVNLLRQAQDCLKNERSYC